MSIVSRSSMFILCFALLFALASAGRNVQRKALLSRADRHPLSKPCHQPSNPRPCARRRQPSSSYSSASCPSSRSCSYSNSCSMSVSWEESEVRAEIVRQRIKNPRHRLYYCPSSTSSTREDCHHCNESNGCPTEYTTIEVIRPHVGRHHKRKVHVKEEVCSLSTEIEVIKKDRCKEKCPKKCKPRYEIICKKPCEKKPKKRCEKKKPAKDCRKCKK